MTRNRFPLLLTAVVVVVAASWAIAAAGRPAEPPAPPEPPDFVLAAVAPPAPPAPPAPGRHSWTSDDDGSVRVISLGGGSWLGVHIKELSPEKASDLNLDRVRGALVTEVVEESPADKAGIRNNDVIVEFDGENVSSTTALRRMVRETPVGRTVELRVMRDGRSVSVEVEIQGHSGRGIRFFSPNGEKFEMEGLHNFVMPDIEFPDIDFDSHGFDFNFEFGRGPRLGVSVESLSSQLAEYFDVPSGNGVLITEVHDDTPAERSGLKAGDVIVGIGDRDVENLRTLNRELRRNEGETVSITIIRDRSSRTLEVTLDKPERRKGMILPDGSRIRLRELIRNSTQDRHAELREAMKALKAANEQRAVMFRAHQEGYRQQLEEQDLARREMMEALQQQLKTRRLRMRSAGSGVEI